MLKGYDYEKLLETARKKMPEIRLDDTRFEPPTLEVVIVGNRTIIKNFVQAAKKLGREPEFMFKYFAGELGTSGSLVENRAEFTGRFDERKVNKKLESFMKGYVYCSECGKPDTVLVKEGGTLMVKCQACGARKPAGKTK